MSHQVHTPPPWKQSATNPENVSAGSALICRTFYRGKYEKSNEHIANARLISAAPDMLYALDWLIKEYEEGDGIIPDGLYMAARRATLKATA